MSGPGRWGQALDTFEFATPDGRVVTSDPSYAATIQSLTDPVRLSEMDEVLTAHRYPFGWQDEGEDMEVEE